MLDRRLLLSIFALLIASCSSQTPGSPEAIVQEADRRQKVAEAAVQQATARQPSEIVDALRTLIREGDDVTRLSALQALRQRGQEAFPAAIDAVPLLQATFAGTSVEAALFLSQFDDKLSDVASALTIVLKDAEPIRARESAARLLGSCRSAIRDALPDLEAALSTEEIPQVRLQCVLSVAALARSSTEPENCKKVLEQVAERDVDEEVRRNARGMLNGLKIDDPTSPPASEKSQPD